MRFVFHIGASKTATTSLQENVFANLPGVAFIGKPYPHERGDALEGVSNEDSARLATCVEAIIGRPDDAEDCEDLAVMAAPILARIATSGVQCCILSEEALGSSLSPSPRAVAERLKKVFGPGDVMITARNQLTALPSLYLHKMRKGTSSISFDDWLAGALEEPDAFAASAMGESLAQYRYCELADAFADVFPDGEVKIFLYEDMTGNPAAFADALGGFLGADAEPIQATLGAPAQNTAKSAAYYRHQRNIQRYARLRNALAPNLDLARTAPWLWRAKERFKRRTESKIERGAPLRVEPGPESRARIAARFGPDNRRLAERLGIDLEATGYPGLDPARAEKEFSDATT